MSAAVLTFRAAPELGSQTRSLAKAVGMSNSDYVREAVREKNERLMAERIAMLSRCLSAEHLAFNEALDDSAGDGLA
jgi:hypothetical protein